MKKRINNFFKEIFEIIRKPVMSILPGQLAFSFVLSIIPILALLGVIANMFSISVDSLSLFVEDTFPSNTSKLLLPLINGKGFDANMLIFIVSAFFLASKGAYSIITTADILYGIEQRETALKVKARIKSFIITVMLLLLICFLLLVPGFGDYIVLFISSIKGIEHLKQILTMGYDLLKYPISLLLIYFNIKLIYTISPNRNIESKTVTVGALFTTTLWIILTRIYSYYVSNFSNYDIFYGSLSNIIILLLWMYLLSYVFVIGLSINAQNNRIKDE